MRNRLAAKTSTNPVAVTGGRSRLLCTTALQASVVLSFATPALAQLSPTARPTGGVVVGGSAAIAQTTAATTVSQTSQRAAIDWQSFDVGASHTVQFQQPNTTAVVLNRVTGPNPSQIAGSIQANGQVVITNQAGVTFHQGAQVQTAGLVVSAAGITTPNFMAGRMVFDQAPNPDAAVTNAGTITVKQAGLAALVAPRVANSGVINARMGRVVLAGAETHTIDLYGDGLLSIDVTGQVQTAPHGPDGKPVTALVTNTGTITANGGAIQLTASAADGIVQTLVEAGGKLRANTAGGHQGSIVLAGIGGSVRIEGSVAADGRAPGATGGTITAQATGTVTLAAGSRVHANGAAGGGAIIIGSRTGAGTVVAAGARLAANALNTGNGGRIAILSGGATTVNGSIAARGGRNAGNGGAVELSGATLGLTGKIDTAAPAGKIGSILLDPTDVTISDHGGAGTVITPASLEASTGSVTVQADNSIVASSSVTLTGSGQSLTLNAGNFVRIDPGVTLTAYGVNLVAGLGGVDLEGSVASTVAGAGVFLSTTGAVTQGAASMITTDMLTGTVGSAALTSRLNQITNIGSNFGPSLGATAGGIAVVTSTPLTVHAGYFANGVVVPNGQTISFTTDALTLATSRYGSPNLVASAPNGTINLQPFTAGRGLEVTNGAATPGVFSLNTAAFTLISASTLSLGSTTAGPVTLATDGTTIDFGAAGFTNLVLRSAGNISQVGAIGITNIDAAGLNINLAAAGNVIPNITQLIAGNDALLHTGQTLAVNGPVTGPDSVTLSSAGTASPSMTLNANITGATVNLNTYNGASLATSGAILQTAGTITATTLTGLAGSATFASANAANIGNFHTAGNFTYNSAANIQLNGTLQSDTGTVALTAPGAITQGAAGTLLAPVLTGTAGSASFTAATNLVGSLQGFTTNAGGLALTTTLGDGPLQIAGTNTTPTGQTVAIQVDRVAFTPGATIAAPGGTISFAPLTAGRPVQLVSTVTEQSAAALSLTQANAAALQTGTLQLGSATAGPILIGQTNDALSLANHATTLSLISAGAITEGAGATLTVPVLTAKAASVSLPGANQIATLAAVTTTGAVTVNNAAPLTVAGPVTAGGDASLAASTLTLAGNIITPGTLSLAAPGGITQTSGTLTAATLTAPATGTASLPSAGNLIANLGPVAATGDLTLTDARALTVTGAVDPGNVTLRVTGDLTLANIVTGNDVVLVASGSITDVPGGGVTANTFRGTAGATVRLTQTDLIGTLTGFNAGNSFTLANSAPLSVGAAVSSPQISLTAPGSIILIGGVLIANNLTINATGAGSQIRQLTTTSIAPLTAGIAYAQLTVDGGVISLANLVAPNVRLTLALNTGSATGALTVASLFVAGQGGNATLSGTVNGLTGYAAAMASGITRFDLAYTLNGCAIAAVTCTAVVPPPPPPPSMSEPEVASNTLRPDIVLIESLLRPDLFTADLLTLDIARNPTDPDFALPNISDRDY